METLIDILLNPFTLAITGFILALGFIASPYEVKFDDKDDIEI
ncbi:MAG: hypothetical protein ACXVPU_00335 [Bacteroidia bacterium]